MTWLKAIGAFFKKWGLFIGAAAMAIVTFLFVRERGKRKDAEDARDEEKKRADGAVRSAERERDVAEEIEEARKDGNAERAAIEERKEDALSEIASRPKPPKDDPVKVALEIKRRREKREKDG